MRRRGGSFKLTYFLPDHIANVIIFLLFLCFLYFVFAFAALNLTQRTSEAAFDTKIKIKIQQGEFREALKLLNEWRMVDPEVRENLD